MKDNSGNNEHSHPVTHLARTALLTFVLTFMLSRILVFLIMCRTIPDFYLHIKGTHVHHLNYGIFLLSGIGAYLLFVKPAWKKRQIAAAIYGIAMALTFDEFGMWIHLGGSYWQRASWDAVVVISAIFGLVAFAPSIKRFRPHHWISAIILILMLIIFSSLFFLSFKYASQKIKSKFFEVESKAPK
jgi:glucose dehydrogenase